MQTAFRDPERLHQEEQFAIAHGNDTGGELYAFMKEQKRLYKDPFKPLKVIGNLYYTEWLGPWNEVICRINKELKLEENL